MRESFIYPDVATRPLPILPIGNAPPQLLGRRRCGATEQTGGKMGSSSHEVRVVEDVHFAGVPGVGCVSMSTIKIV